MEKFKLKYTGSYSISALLPGFQGVVKPGDVIDVDKKAVDSLRSHEDWELVTEKKQKKGGDE